MSEYKTFEELKEELGDKFEDYMYKANIELLNKLQQKENIIKEVREYVEEHTENVELNIYGMPPVIRSFRGNTQTLLEILDKEEDVK